MSSHPESSASVPGSGLPGKGRVLVVEDDHSVREVIEVLVSIEGCEVETAASGAAALALVETWTPDLILLDLYMPGMDGRAFIQAYHQTTPPHAPIILLSGAELSAEDVADVGADGSLPKPFAVEDLLQIVAQFAECSD